MTCAYFRRARPRGTQSFASSPEVVSAGFRSLAEGASLARRRVAAEADGSGRGRGRRAGGAAMPRYYEDKPEGGACAGVKEDLGACLLQSDCVLQVARPAGRADRCGRGDGRRRRPTVPGRLRWRSGRGTQRLVPGADHSSDSVTWT